jgi:hypothetical protein
MKVLDASPLFTGDGLLFVRRWLETTGCALKTHLSGFERLQPADFIRRWTDGRQKPKDFLPYEIPRSINTSETCSE